MVRHYLSDKNSQKKRLATVGDRFTIWECLQRVKNGKAEICYVLALPDKTGIVLSASELEELARFTLDGIECGIIRETANLSDWKSKETDESNKSKLWGV